MKTQIEKLGKILYEVEMDEYLNEETLPKIRDARGLIHELHEQLHFDSLTSKEAIDYEICAKRKDKEENLKNWAVALFFGTAFIVVLVLLIGWLGS